MVLADDNFASIAAAVAEGRTVYDNLRKTILFLLPTNAAQAMIILLAILAGTTLPLPPPPGPTARNSLDAVADRDFALDYLYAAAVCFVHLSRIGEELVLWTTSEFGFARLPEDAATGSSMMPHKLNADVAELARGKAGTAIGRLAGLLATEEGDGWTVTRTLVDLTPSGDVATNGAVDVVAEGAAATDAVVTTAQEVSCGDLVAGDGGLVEPES